MKRFQSLLASFVLVFALAATAAAGIIHTGHSAVPQPSPTPTPSTQSTAADEWTAVGETDGGETIMLDYVLEAALDCLHATFTLF
jgi:hypothetical protein